MNTKRDLTRWIATPAARGIAFARGNPRQAREFARALGVLAKTGKVPSRQHAAPAPAG